MALSEQRKGELSLLITALLNGFLPIVVVLSYAAVSSLASLFWSTLFATIFFLVVVNYRGRWKELRNALLWKYAFLIALIIGVVTYSLYFIALETTTPGNVAIIVLFEVFTSFLFFRIFKGERFSFDYALGAVLMIIGAVIVLGRDFSGMHLGDLLILVMCVFAPIGNFFQQKAREIASSETIMFLRSALSLPGIFLLAYYFGAHASAREVFVALPLLILNGILLLGFSKLFWIEAIHRISVTKGTALASISPFVTLILAWIILQQAPTVWQIASLVPFVLGTLLLTDQVKLRPVRALQ